MNPYISESAGRVLLRIYLQPRSSKNRVAGLHGGELKVAVTAPPVDNAANGMVVAFLADLLGVPKSSLTVIAGLSSRHKTIAITGKTASEVTTILGQ